MCIIYFGMVISRGHFSSIAPYPRYPVRKRKTWRLRGKLLGPGIPKVNWRQVLVGDYILRQMRYHPEFGNNHLYDLIINLVNMYSNIYCVSGTILFGSISLQGLMV